jgi:hypothetical protein
VNLTLEPESQGYLVESRLTALFSAAEMAEYRSVYIAKQVVANEIERLMAVLDALEDDADMEPTFAGTDWTDGDPRLDDAEHEDPDLDEADDEDSDHSGCGDWDGIAEQGV